MAAKTIPLFNSEGQPVKECCTCGIKKGIADFNRDSHLTDGLKSLCRDCEKVYYNANRDRILKQKKHYARAHKDEKAVYNKAYWKDNEESLRIKSKQYREINKDEINTKAKEYYLVNKSQIMEYRRVNKKALSKTEKIYRSRPDIKAKRARRQRKRRRIDPKFRLNGGMSSNIHRALQGPINGKHWEGLVGYSIQDLRKHLEKQFTDGMSWDNYGAWHIDHKVPLAAHNFTSPSHLDFKRAWALSNLQPLWAYDNQSKSDSIDKPFQPTLQLEFIE